MKIDRRVKNFGSYRAKRFSGRETKLSRRTYSCVEGNRAFHISWRLVIHGGGGSMHHFLNGLKEEDGRS